MGSIEASTSMEKASLLNEALSENFNDILPLLNESDQLVHDLRTLTEPCTLSSLHTHAHAHPKAQLSLAIGLWGAVCVKIQNLSMFSKIVDV